jgi:mTERF domain-containing protein
MFASRVASRIFPSRATVSPTPASPRFILKKYLFATCGLTRPQAHKASEDIPYLNSPTKPHAVIAYLAGLGLSRRDIASLLSKDPEFLCARTERILNPVLSITALRLWADLEDGPGRQ